VRSDLLLRSSIQAIGATSSHPSRPGENASAFAFQKNEQAIGGTATLRVGVALGFPCHRFRRGCILVLFLFFLLVFRHLLLLILVLIFLTTLVSHVCSFVGNVHCKSGSMRHLFSRDHRERTLAQIGGGNSGRHVCCRRRVETRMVNNSRFDCGTAAAIREAPKKR